MFYCLLGFLFCFLIGLFLLSCPLEYLDVIWQRYIFAKKTSPSPSLSLSLCVGGGEGELFSTLKRNVTHDIGLSQYQMQLNLLNIK